MYFADKPDYTRGDGDRCNDRRNGEKRQSKTGKAFLITNMLKKLLLFFT